jgi:hypothetical protein
MSELAPFHAAFLAALNNADDVGFAQFLERPGALNRIAVYRNTALNGQIEALAGAYPTVLAGLGEDRFRDLAKAYALAHPSRSRSFALYGAGLEAFIATHAKDAETLALADLAALDRAWLEAHSAADEGVLAASTLAGLNLPSAILRVHPSVHCVPLRFESLALWAALKDNAQPPPTLAEHPGAALIWRAGLEVVHQAVGRGEAAFFNAIRSGDTLEAAVNAAIAKDPDFDPAGAFAGMLAAGLFSGVAHQSEPLQ